MECETCAYYTYDEEEDAWYCETAMDQDDYVRISRSGFKGCPYYRNGDEYAVVRHQI